MTRMPNENGFKPYKPEEKMIASITKREAVLIAKLRRHAYGKFLIHKINGTLVRVEINDSQLIEEDTEVNLD